MDQQRWVFKPPPGSESVMALEIDRAPNKPVYYGLADLAKLLPHPYNHRMKLWRLWQARMIEECAWMGEVPLFDLETYNLLMRRAAVQ